MTEEIKKLLERNNIKRPKYFGVKKFDEAVDLLEHEYRIFVETSKHVQEKWKKCQDLCQKNWNTDFPALSEFGISLELPHFKNIKQALQFISDFTMEISVKSKKFHQKQVELDVSLRKAWIDELIAKAGNDCKLIVIKSDYRPVYKNTEENFNQSVKNYEESYICYCGFLPVWVAFNPINKIDAMNWSFYWKIYRERSTIEFIR